ncbi:MAG: Fis family transcriptional regulator [Sulfurospirillum sp.]|nr:Fis family transcriptional regulator [Sulfurospirillum sp.]
MQTTMKMAVDAVDHTKYIARSRASVEALKSANLLKNLNINALIYGESGVGKVSLCKHILPESIVVDGENLDEVLECLSTQNNLIIKNFHRIGNFQKVKSVIKLHKTRIIATSLDKLSEKIADEFFSLKITIPPLRDRLEDVSLLAEKFFKEVSIAFGFLKKNELSLENFSLDLSQNCFSLRKSIYLKYLINSMSEQDVLEMMEAFLSKKVGGKDDYRELLYLFDVPLIKCGFKKFHSQLLMSEKFGLNRNTLRKKINDYKDTYQLQ